ncbi:hypothetical protein [Ekhidna sp.]|uniref:hypothetical protein n=1 Tax=Ekhidna sp. TaxID=2608089 RepID=UPI003559845D
MKSVPSVRGKSLFFLALVTIIVTCITVYFTGIEYNRSISNNLYISLSIIAFFLFISLSIFLYLGVTITNNYPKIQSYKLGSLIFNSSGPGSGTGLPDLDINGGDGIGGFFISILIWIGMAIILILLLVLFEAIFWISLFIIFASLYWIFIRAMIMALYKSRTTKGNLLVSITHALKYTILYTGWLFGITLIVQLIS